MTSLLQLDRLKDFHIQTSGKPKVFRQLAIELPVLNFTLERLKEAFGAHCVDRDAKSVLLPALEEYNQAMEQLNPILAKIMPIPQGSWREKSMKFLKSL